MKLLLIASNDYPTSETVASMVQDSTKGHSVGLVKLQNNAVYNSTRFSDASDAVSQEIHLAARKHSAYDLGSVLAQGEPANIQAIASRNVVGVLAVHQAELFGVQQKLSSIANLEVKSCFIQKDPELGFQSVMHFTSMDSPSPSLIEKQCDFILEGMELSAISRQLIFSTMNEFAITTEFKLCDQPHAALLMSSPVAEQLDSVALVAERAANRSKTNATLCLNLTDSIINSLQQHKVSEFDALPRTVQEGLIKDAFCKRQLNSYQMGNLLGSSGSPSSVSEPNFKAIVNYAQFMNLQLARLHGSTDLLNLFSVVEHIDNASLQAKYTGPDRKMNLLPCSVINAIQVNTEKHAQPYAKDILAQLSLRSDGISISDRLTSPARTMFYETSAELAQRVVLPRHAAEHTNTSQLTM